MKKTQIRIIGAGLLPYHLDNVGTQVFQTVGQLLEALIHVESNKLKMRRRKATLKGKTKPSPTLK